MGSLVVGKHRELGHNVYYEIATGKEIFLPGKDWHCESYSRNRRYLHFVRPSGATYRTHCVYDLKEQRVCLNVPSCEEAWFLKDGRFATLSGAFGISTVVYDLETGQSIRQAPYLWCGWAMPTILLSWFAWWWAWVVVSVREGGRQFIALAVVAICIPGGLFLMFAAPNDLMLPAFSEQFNVSLSLFLRLTKTTGTLYGWLLGLLCAGVFYATLSTHRLWVRMIPPSVVFSAILLWLDTNTRSPSSNYLRIALTVLLTIAILAIVLYCLRTRGRLKLQRETAEEGSRSEQKTAREANEPQVTMVDLIALVTCVAVMIAAIKTHLQKAQGINLSRLLDAYWLPTTLVACSLAFVVLFTVLQRSRALWIFGCTLAAAVWCVFVLQRLLLLADYPVDGVDPYAVLAVSVTSALSFLGGLSFRLHGWRLNFSGRSPQQQQ